MEVNPRFKLWGLLAVASAVSLGAVVSGAPKPRTHDEKYVIATTSISLILATLNASFVKFAKPGHEDYLRKGEGGIAFVLFVLWCAAIGVINEVISVAAGSLYVVTNANVYYFTWTCFFLVLAILGNSVQGDAANAGTRSSRTSKWMVLAASSLIVMASSITIFRAEGCRGLHGSFCRAVNIGLGMGCCCGVIALAVVLMVSQFTGDNPNKFVQVEAIVGGLFVILYAIAVAYITGPGGPGSTIGNLYYSTWVSFLTSVAITLDSIGVLTKDLKLPASMQGVQAGNEEPSNPPPEAPISAQKDEEEY